MEILIAEDDAVSRRILERYLVGWGYEVRLAKDGEEAYQMLEGGDRPPLAILDWMMPGMDGIQVCRKVRERPVIPSLYIILLTARGGKPDIVEGLEAGADDYVVKPFDREELRVRVKVGARFVELQHKLAQRIHELRAALQQVKQLEGLLPICSYCKKIRGDDNYWQRLESYISKHTNAQFSHGICPECYQSIVKPELKQLAQQQVSAR